VNLRVRKNTIADLLKAVKIDSRKRGRAFTKWDWHRTQHGKGLRATMPMMRIKDNDNNLIEAKAIGSVALSTDRYIALVRDGVTTYFYPSDRHTGWKASPTPP